MTSSGARDFFRQIRSRQAPFLARNSLAQRVDYDFRDTLAGLLSQFARQPVSLGIVYV